MDFHQIPLDRSAAALLSKSSANDNSASWRWRVARRCAWRIALTLSVFILTQNGKKQKSHWNAMPRESRSDVETRAFIFYWDDQRSSPPWMLLPGSNIVDKFLARICSLMFRLVEADLGLLQVCEDLVCRFRQCSFISWRRVWRNSCSTSSHSLSDNDNVRKDHVSN